MLIFQLTKTKKLTSMETPSSTRRITRSQASAMAAEKRGINQSREKSAEKPKKDRSALIDITNDSPIVGLAINHETPSSAMSKKRIVANLSKYTRTPGSGEALLRGQVKTLLQKVEEEAGFSKITIEKRPLFDLQGLVSPALSLIAPTPANTPQLLIGEEGTKSDDLVTRTLLFDISEINGASDGEDEDDSSIWSIQVNPSNSTREDEDEEEEEDGEDSGLFDELCEGMSNMRVCLPKFTGKHIRFMYNSDDDEIRGEEEIVVVSGPAALAE